jgi:hypothetical protein
MSGEIRLGSWTVGKFIEKSILQNPQKTLANDKADGLCKRASFRQVTIEITAA